MRPTRGFILVVGVLVGAGSITYFAQRQKTAALQAEVEQLRDQSRERQRVKTENARLLAEQVSATALENLRSDHAALLRMRAEVAAAKKRAQETARRSTAANAVDAQAKVYEPSIMDGDLPAAMWKNQGSATPAAAIETALWAAAGGDIDQLSRMLVFGPGAREKAAALLAALPASSDASGVHYDSVEQLVASLTAKDIPLGRARLHDVKMSDGEGVRFVAAQLSKAEEKPRLVFLTLRSENDQWKLVVPQSAIANYEAVLNRPSAGVAVEK